MTLGAYRSTTAAIADFNRDGKLDFALTNNNLQIFLGNGDGTFQEFSNYLVDVGSLSVAVADFNHDGKLDLAVASFSGLNILFGNGDGTFQAPTTYSTACVPTFVGIADFNGDHKLDLIVTYSSATCGYVSIFPGNGDGTFQSAPINTALYYPAATGIGDFNGDGNLDLAVVQQFELDVLLGNGDGTFANHVKYEMGADPTSVAVADLRNNGKLDLVVTTLEGTYMFLGNGDGTFRTGPPTGAFGEIAVLADDLNGDGKLDLAVNTITPDFLYVALGNGDGTFQPPTFYPAGINDFFLATGDFNSDHKTDLLVADSAPGEMITLLNTGVASFSPTSPVNFPFQLLGTISPPKTVTLTNTGTTALTISSMRFNGPFRQSNRCGTSVAPGAQCEIQFTFKPPAIGNATGTMVIQDSASSKPQIIELTGAGTVVRVSPQKIDFGDQKVGTTGPQQTVTVTNTGSTPLTIDGLGLCGGNFDFPETDNCLRQTLGAGGSCTINMSFAPKKTGRRAASFCINDAGGGSPQTVLMTGTGT